MKPNITLAVILICSFVFCENIQAQEKSDSSLAAASIDSTSKIDTAIQKVDTTISTEEGSGAPSIKSYFTLGVNYINDNVYLGRKDSSAIPYLTPKIGYYAKSGFFTEASFGILTTPGISRLDMVSLSAGYSFSAGNYDGQISASKYYYNSQSTSVKSEVKGNLEFYNSYDLGFIRPSIATMLNIGNKTDFGGAFGLERSFVVIEDKFDLTPTFTLNASTQNYYNDYYSKRRFSVKRKGKPPVIGGATITGEVLNASTFKVLDYEISMPINYKAGKFTFNFTPVYAIPVHPTEVVVTTKFNNGTTVTRTGFEKIENSFFGTLEVIYKF